MLCSPGMCSGCSVASCRNKIVASLRATLSCVLFLTGLNVEWWSQPAALLLSVKARMWWKFECFGVSFVRVSLTVTIAAMNSRRLMEPL